jgi:hypothetical protein
MDSNLLDSDFNEKERNIELLKPILWWEKKRLYYNIAVGLTGVLGCISNWDIFESHSIIYAFCIFLYGLLANICYTLGWASEIYFQIFISKYMDLKIENYRVALFIIGTLFSMAITVGGIFAALFSNSRF